MISDYNELRERLVYLASPEHAAAMTAEGYWAPTTAVIETAKRMLFLLESVRAKPPRSVVTSPDGEVVFEIVDSGEMTSVCCSGGQCEFVRFGENKIIGTVRLIVNLGKGEIPE